MFSIKKILTILCITVFVSHINAVIAQNQGREIEIELGEAPDNEQVKIQLQEANALRNQLLLDEALQAYQQIITAYPQSKQKRIAELNIAHIFADRDEHDEAISRYEAFINQYYIGLQDG